MKDIRRIFILVLCVAVGAAMPGLVFAGEPEYREGALLVTVDTSECVLYKDGDNRDEIAHYVQTSVLGEQDDIAVARVLNTVPDDDDKAVALISSDSATTDELIARMAGTPKILGYAKDYANYPSSIAASSPSDSRWSEQWGPKAINVQNVWNNAAGGEEVVVAVLDTGILYDHEDLAANMYVLNEGAAAADKGAYGVWFFRSESCPVGPDATVGAYTSADADRIGDVDGHGSHVAGIIGAVSGNGKGISGVGRNVKLLAFNVYAPHSENGKVVSFPVAYDSDVIDAMDYILRLRRSKVNVRVANLSFGSWRSKINNPALDPLGSKIKELSNNGVIVVISAGNEAENIDSPSSAHSGERPYPACFKFDNTLTVGAIESDGARDYMSNYSAGGSWIDIVAPGTNILSTVRRSLAVSQGANRYDSSGYMRLSGTSMAAPHVSGTAALLCSIFPDKSAEDIVAMIRRGAYAGTGQINFSQYGMLDALGAYLRGAAIPVKITVPAIESEAVEALEAQLLDAEPAVRLGSIPEAAQTMTANGSVTLSIELIDSAVSSLLKSGEAAKSVAMLPLFTGKTTKSGVAAYAFNIEGSYLGTQIPALQVATVGVNGQGRLLKRVSDAKDYADGTFLVMRSGKTVTTGSIAQTGTYTLVLFESDGGESDIDSAASAMTTQAILFTKHSKVASQAGTEGSDGGGGGCDLFLGSSIAALLLLCAAMVVKTK